MPKPLVMSVSSWYVKVCFLSSLLGMSFVVVRRKFEKWACFKFNCWRYLYYPFGPSRPFLAGNLHYLYVYLFFVPQLTHSGLGRLPVEVSRSHTHASHSLELLWTRDRPFAETSTWQHTVFTTDIYPCPRRDSNPQPQQASGSRKRTLG